MKLSKIISALGGAIPDGDGYLAHCPAHDDTEASLRIAYSGAGKALIACRAGCDFVKVIAASSLDASDLFEVEDDMGAVELPTEDAEIDESVYERLDEYVATCTVMRETEFIHATEYAKERFGVTPELFEHWALGHDNCTVSAAKEYPDLFGSVYSKSERLVVPFYSPADELLGLQARAIHDDSKAKWSGPSNPETGGTWGKMAFFDSQSGMDWVVITEGPGDAMTSAAAGSVDAVGIRGASMANAVAEELTEWVQGRTVFLAGDNDKAGTKFNETLARGLALRNVPTHTLTLPDGTNDICDWYAEDREGFSKAFQAALSAAEGESSQTRDDAKAKPISLYIPTTDVGLAKYVLRQVSKGRLAYNEGFGFVVYHDGAWSRDETDDTRRMIYNAADELHTLADKTMDADAAGIARSSANRLQSTREIDKVLTEMRTMSMVRMDKFNQQDHLLVVNNGTVDLRTGELLDHDPEHYSLQRVGFDYDPEAECPRWLQFLEEVFPNDREEMPLFMQRLVGYAITGETQEQCFAILWGLGANGKSVFTNTISHVFDELTKVTPFSTFEQKAGGIPNDLAALHDARMVLAAEGERGKPMAEAVIKRATGMDKIPARFLHREFFEYRPKFFLWLSTNHKPNFRSADNGLWRRVKMIEWSRYFDEDERDHYLEAKLRNETEGILAWAVRGAIDWYEQGLDDPPTVIDATEAYRDNSDALSGLFGPNGLVESKGSWTSASEVYKAYREWAFKNELPPKDTWGRNTFYNGMDERGYRRLKAPSGEMSYRDIKISDELSKGMI